MDQLLRINELKRIFGYIGKANSIYRLLQNVRGLGRQFRKDYNRYKREHRRYTRRRSYRRKKQSKRKGTKAKVFGIRSESQQRSRGKSINYTSTFSNNGIGTTLTARNPNHRFFTAKFLGKEYGL